jgi:hypothetical protein
MKTLQQVAKLPVGTPEGLELDRICDACTLANLTPKSFKRVVSKRARPHGPECGEACIAGGTQVRYDKTRQRMVYFLCAKSEALAAFKCFILDVKGLGLGLKVRGIRYDNGGEHTSKAFD